MNDCKEQNMNDYEEQDSVSKETLIKCSQEFDDEYHLLSVMIRVKKLSYNTNPYTLNFAKER